MLSDDRVSCGVFDEGRDIALLVAAVMGASLDAISIDGLKLHQKIDGVGKLEFPACT